MGRPIVPDTLTLSKGSVCIGRKTSRSGPFAAYENAGGSIFFMAGSAGRTDSGVKDRTEIKNQDPKLYNVVLLNDDYTTMEFVMQVLETLFQKSPAEAFRIMMHVHRNGRGLAGVYTWEVAETKADQVAALAAEAGYPLRATIEEA